MTFKDAKLIFDRCNTWGEYKDRMLAQGVEEEKSEEFWSTFLNYLNDTL